MTTTLEAGIFRVLNQDGERVYAAHSETAGAVLHAYEAGSFYLTAADARALADFLTQAADDAEELRRGMEGMR